MPYDATTAHPDVPTAQATESKMLFEFDPKSHSTYAKKEFFNIEQHRSMDDARPLRAVTAGTGAWLDDLQKSRRPRWPST
jgi:hypothetical protein